MGEGVALQQKWGLYNCQEYTEHPQGHKLKSGRKKGKGENQSKFEEKLSKLY